MKKISLLLLASFLLLTCPLQAQQDEDDDKYKKFEQEAIGLLGKEFVLSKTYRFKLVKGGDNALTHQQYVFSKTSNYSIAIAGNLDKPDQVQIRVYDENNQLVAKNTNNTTTLRFTPPKGGIYRITFESTSEKDLLAVGAIGFAKKEQ